MNDSDKSFYNLFKQNEKNDWRWLICTVHHSHVSITTITSRKTCTIYLDYPINISVIEILAFLCIFAMHNSNGYNFLDVQEEEKNWLFFT